MESLFKEGKKIVHSYTKCAMPFEIFNEVAGYAHAKKVGLSTANLLHHSDRYLTIEFVDGISCFRYLELLRLRGKEYFPRMRDMLTFLLGDVSKFHSEEVAELTARQPYEVEEKTAKVAEVMTLVGHHRRFEVAERVERIAETFIQYATASFRDATPKNAIMEGVFKDEALYISAEGARAAVRHIDFRSVGEMTSPLDDVISILLHYMVPEDMRQELYQEYGADTHSEEFVVTCFVRVARFWGRRHFYLRRYPDLYKKRYDLEDLSFYDEQFDQATEKLLEVLI